MKQIEIKPETNEHVFIVVREPDRPVLSIDIDPHHGRRTMSVRVSGMVMFGGLCDIVELDPTHNERMIRYCPYCGDELNLVSLRPHECSQ